MLADDSDDEKKIEKAEKAAERKLAKRRKVQEVKREGLAARSLPRPRSEPTPKAPFASPKPAIAAVPRPKYPWAPASSAATRAISGGNAPKQHPRLEPGTNIL